MIRSDLFFQAVALPYELLTRHPVWERHCAQMAGELPPGARQVLDLGCGPGNSASHLRDSVAHVVALDPAPAMLRCARRRDGRLRLVQADARALPLRDGCLDAVTFHSVLYLLSDRAAAVRETARVLRPGGRAILLEPQQDLLAAGRGLLRALPDPRWALGALLWRALSGVYGRFTTGSLRTMLESSGLRVLRIAEALDGLALLAVAERPA